MATRSVSSPESPDYTGFTAYGGFIIIIIDPNAQHSSLAAKRDIGGAMDSNTALRSKEAMAETLPLPRICDSASYI